MTDPNNAVHLSADYSAPPDLKTYDILLCNISGGKDSQAMLDVVVEATKNAGVGDRVVTVFCDLGDEDEWPGTKQLAAEHAAHYCVRHEIVFRQVPDGAGAMRQQGLTEHIESRRQQKWPDKARRFCTSDMKRAPVHKLMTRLVAEKRALGIIGRRVRILNIMGMRAEESIDRAAMVPYRNDARASNKTKREVDEWLPLLDWKVQQVWARLAKARTRIHPIYAVLPRLSCRFCVLAGRRHLVTAARLDPAGARRRAELEAAMEHQFRPDVSMAQILAEAEAINRVDGPLAVDGLEIPNHIEIGEW
ncbi:3'-phosphoadenosine 5'-phosphosulfate sulfotransferase (PAPS reductase)/FAD synthetase [Actinomadura pelletieri DSM 43383]|uniref:3'-phosphoadenosine 5'-phosphosulfate sulfotransferase (PAPS reductase)/FAD synthetase n=1 Tax=Actinomadura pelletieri DSM 43383 TaxID=1120940 RepID=A0A495QWZ6_9ACTN|nr:phosphoadenosine phosphosulfate reductase family protein [Actinomadura pelletieri]RKS78597.1 3'-phosphoadenosine 5'-phosphosulfate sulfotransferase (PAPS reductase)/FAD synthetase [Actinomadura pelletieri DSM 43383]